MVITNFERITQLSSAAESALYVLRRKLPKDVLDISVSQVQQTTIKDLLDNLDSIVATINNADPHYFADIDIGYTEDSFPVQHY